MSDLTVEVTYPEHRSIAMALDLTISTYEEMIKGLSGTPHDYILPFYKTELERLKTARIKFHKP